MAAWGRFIDESYVWALGSIIVFRRLISMLPTLSGRSSSSSRPRLTPLDWPFMTGCDGGYPCC
jgi:hypothetical protein